MVVSPLGNSVWRAPRHGSRRRGRWTSPGSAGSPTDSCSRCSSTAAPDTATTAAMYLFGSFREPSARGPSSIRGLLIMRTLITRAAGLTRRRPSPGRRPPGSWKRRSQHEHRGLGQCLSRLFSIKPPAPDGEHPAVITHRDALVLNNNDTLKRNSVRISSGRSTAAGEAPKEVHDRSKWERRYAANLRITDTVVVCGAVILAQYVRFGAPATAPSYVNHYVTAYSALLAIIWLSALAVFRTRSPRYIGAGIEEYRRVAAASFWTFGAIAMAELLLKLQISRGYLAVALPAGVLGLVLSRWMWRVYVARKRAQGAYSTAVLAIGGSDAVANLASELTDDPKNGYHVVGVGITGYGAPRGEQLIVNDREIPIVGGVTYALQAIRDCGADTVAIAGTGEFGVQGLRRLIWELEPMGVDLMVSPGVMDVALNRLVMRPIAGLPLLHIEKPQYQGAKRFQKRAFDILLRVLRPSQEPYRSSSAPPSRSSSPVGDQSSTPPNASESTAGPFPC